MRRFAIFVIFVVFAVFVTFAVQLRENHGPRAAAGEPNFRFKNNFWVNLHHTLRGEARRREVKAPSTIKTSGLKPEERAAWTSALDAYVDYGRRDLVFDDRLIRINNTLTQVTDEGRLQFSPSALEPAARRALTAAAPIYHAHFWPAQQQLNDHWIAAIQPVVAAHGSAMASALARIYRVTWPADQIIVDAASEAGPNGAYTTDGPMMAAAHTTIESANPEHQGDMAFEILFHEASHAGGVGDRLSAALNAEAARQKTTPNRDLWHAVIFYTTGELAKRELGKAGDPQYKPYAYRYGVYTRGWQRLRDALERDWLPYLDGGASFEEAIAAVVRDAS